MIVRNFTDIDIEEASKITRLVWGDLYAKESETLQKVIYDFTLKYYYLNNKFSFALDDEGLKGLIFASLKTDKNNSVENFKTEIQTLSDNDKITTLNLLDYVENTGKEVKSIMTENDLMMGLFISTQKGGGKMLLSKLVETAEENGIKNIYLWTDTTCDFDYYQKNKFTCVKEIESYVNSKKINTLIFKKGMQKE